MKNKFPLHVKLVDLYTEYIQSVVVYQNFIRGWDLLASGEIDRRLKETNSLYKKANNGG